MSTYFPDDDTADGPAPSSETQPVLGPALVKCDEIEVPLPPFNRSDAIAIIEQRLKLSTQLIAIHMALRTKKNGVVKISMTTLSTITGLHRDTIGDLIAEIVELGLLKRKLTRDGYVYTWTSQAYKVGHVTSVYGIWRSPTGEAQSGQHEALRRLVVSSYLSAWRGHYGIPADTQVSRDASTISDAQLVAMEPYLFDLASRVANADEPKEMSLARAAKLFFLQWCTREGKHGCMKKAKHPLWRLSSQDIFEDFTAVFANIAQKRRDLKELEEHAAIRQPSATATREADTKVEARKLLNALTNQPPKKLERVA